MRRCTMSYQYGTYSGTATVDVPDWQEPADALCAKFAREGLLTLGMAYWSARVVDEEDLGDDA